MKGKLPDRNQFEQISTLMHHVNREMVEILERWETSSINTLRNSCNSYSCSRDIEVYDFLDEMSVNLKYEAHTLTNETFLNVYKKHLD